LTRSSLFGPWLWLPVVLVIDFLTKRIVLDNIPVFSARIEVLGDFVRLAYVRNPGAAMGLALGGRPLLIAISAVVTVALLVFYVRTDPALRIRRGAIAVIAGGALGNLIDRIFYDGLVVDFIDIGLGSHRFWTFNVADMGVTLGGAVLFLCLWRDSRVEQSKPAPEPIPSLDTDGRGDV